MTVRVETNSACAWTAASDVGWATVEGSDRGTGAGSVTVNVAANNTTSARTGTLTVAGQTVTVTQPGLEAVELNGDVLSVSGECPSLTFVLASVSGKAGATTIITGSATNFTKGSCRDVRAGARLKVVGVRLPDGRVSASEVQVQKE